MRCPLVAHSRRPSKGQDTGGKDLSDSNILLIYVFGHVIDLPFCREEVARGI
jgi:hypothetical protein